MDMNAVERRYQSLALKHSYLKFEINLHTLARAGFYANGENNKTSCYSCGIVIEKWSYSDDIWEKHRTFSPHCEHVHVSGPVKNVQDSLASVFWLGEISLEGENKRRRERFVKLSEY